MIRVVSLQDIPKTSRHLKKNIRIEDIERFLATGAEAAEIIVNEGEAPTTVLSATANAIKKRKQYSDMCYVIQRGGRVFLVRWPDKRTGK